MNLVGDVSFFAVIRVAVPGQTIILSGQCSWHSALPANAVVSWNRMRRWKTSFIIHYLIGGIRISNMAHAALWECALLCCC